MIRFSTLLILLAAGATAQIPATALRDGELAGVFQTTAAQPSTVHHGLLMRQLEPLMIQQSRYLVSELKPWAKDPRAALLPLISKTASSENGVRPNAHTAKGLAILVRLAPDDAFPTEFSRPLARERALAMLRYLLHTHGASGETCTDGKPWHNQWQSAYWAAMTGEAAWLLWDELAPDERWLAARMVCDEADRFVDLKPPTNLHEDTKAEENAWNSEIVSLAFNMFPAHPRHAVWRETAIRWIASSFATEHDTTRTDLVDGKPLKDWIAGINIYDDFTLENHHRVHPDYMACTYLLTSQVSMYTWGHHAPPEAINLNVEAINAIIKLLSTPEGSVIYPNGQDWGLHRNVDWFEYHATMAVLYHDRQSAELLRHSLAAITRMAQRTPKGAVYLPTETKLASDQHMVLEYAAHVYALMAQFGEGPEPVPDAQLWRELAGSRIFAAGKFGVARTKDSIATFSWGAQVMGQVLPLQDDLLLTPEGRGLVGYVTLEGQPHETPIVKQIALAPLAEGFGVIGVIDRGTGALEQRFGFLALPDGRTVYVDQLSALSPATITQLDLGTLGVLNDPHWAYHDGKRTVFYAGGQRTFAAAQAETDTPATWDSPWFNLDGKLGIVRLAAAGPAVYNPASTGAAGRLEQRFHLSTLSSTALAAAKSGAPLAFDAYVLYPNRNVAQTQAIAAQCALLSEPGAHPIRLRLDDRTEVSFDLDQLHLQIVPPVQRARTARVVEALAERVADHHLAGTMLHHVLDRAAYLPSALGARQGLTRCVTPEGEVTRVQAIGSAPTNVDPSKTDDYGVGAFLLAASEIRRLGDNSQVTRSSHFAVHASILP